MSVYTEAGFKNRKDYLNSVAEDFGAPIGVVYSIASLLGPDEDFDALITEVEDYCDRMEPCECPA